MVQVSRPPFGGRAGPHTGFGGPALARLLAGLSGLSDLSGLPAAGGPAAPDAGQGFADRLSQWLRWTDAIALSAALGPAQRVAAPGSAASPSASAESAQAARVRAAAVTAIAEAARAVRMELPGDFAPFRRRYVARQQAMATGIGSLRERLRATLAARTPAQARLAAIDAVMEQALGGHEHRLLSSVPALLEKHFKQLEQPDQEAFGKRMQGVLLAELEIRMQPVEGLVEALAGPRHPSPSLRSSCAKG